MQASSKARSSARISKAQYEMLAAFRYQLRQFLHFSEQAAQKAGLTPRQHQALLAIKGFPNRESITIGELAEQLQIAHHSHACFIGTAELGIFSVCDAIPKQWRRDRPLLLQSA